MEKVTMEHELQELAYIFDMVPGFILDLLTFAKTAWVGRDKLTAANNAHLLQAGAHG